MAVTTTAQDIVTAAYGKSAKNRPGSIATDATELVKMLTRAMRGLFAYAARVNCVYFASQTDVPFTGGLGWRRPESAELIFRIELPPFGAAAEVVVVPFDDRAAEPSMPAVYELGQYFRTAGNALDPVAGDLRFFFARRVSDIPTLATTLDSDWPEQFNELLALEMAIYLALKDGRQDELPALRAMRDSWADLFTAYLEHATANEVRRVNNVRRFNTRTLVPLRSLLAGGAA